MDGPIDGIVAQGHGLEDPMDAVFLVASSTMTGNTWRGEVRQVFVELRMIKEEQAMLAIKRESAKVKKWGTAYAKDCGVCDIAWITKNRTMAVGGDDGTIEILSMEKMRTQMNEPLETITSRHFMIGHDDVVTSLSTREKWLVSSSMDGTIKVWDLSRPIHAMDTIRIGDRAVWQVGFDWNDTSNTIFTCTQGGGLLLWDSRRVAGTKATPTMQLIKPGTGVGCLCATFNKVQEHKIACGREDGTVLVFDKRKPGQELNIFPSLHDGCVHCISYNENMDILASGGDDCVVNLVNAQGEVIGASRQHSDYVRALAWQDTCLVTGSWDKTLGSIIVSASQ